MYWNHQVNLATKESSIQVKTTRDSTHTKESTAQVKTTDIVEKRVLRTLPNHFPDSLANKLQMEQKLSLMVIGDAATSSAPTWPAKLKEELDHAYGEGVWTITVKEWDGKGTEKFLAHNRLSEISVLKPDIVLFEVPLITDNLETESGHLLTNVQAILRQLRTKLPNCTVVLQPPTPVYHAKYYGKEIEALQQIAEQNQYLYNDRWAPWPSASSAEILNYLKHQESLPNEQVQELRGKAVSRYFTEE